MLTEAFNSTVGVVSLSVLLALLTVRTILDALVALGLAPKKLRDWLAYNRREELRTLITELGLQDQVKRARSTAQVLSIRREFHEENDKLRARLEAIVASHIDEGDYRIGSTSKHSVNYFANLRQAFCEATPGEELDRVLAEIMIEFIANECRKSCISFDLVVARRNGLDVLGYLVAKSMNKPFLLYSARDGVFVRSKGKSEVKVLDYTPERNHRAIIVDDSCVGGSEFREMASALKESGSVVTDVFVLFCREEVNAAKSMANDKLTLHALDSYGDERLGRLREKQ